MGPNPNEMGHIKAVQFSKTQTAARGKGTKEDDSSVTGKVQRVKRIID